MSIGQTPTWLDAKKCTTVGPKGDIGHACEIEHDPASARRIVINKLAIRHINEFKDERAGKLSPIERHFSASKSYLFGFATKIVSRRKPAAIAAGGHL